VIVVAIVKISTNIAALAELNTGSKKDNCIEFRQNNYLINFMEQDHRDTERLIKVMTGSTDYLVWYGNYPHATERSASSLSRRGIITAGKFYLLTA